MMPKNNYEQFTTRNMNELAEVIQSFHELLSVSPRYTLYLDVNGWEVFDTDFGKSVIRHNFKNLKAMRVDIITLMRDLVNIGSAQYSNRIKSSVTWSEKHLLTIYSQYELNKMFPHYEQRKKIQVMAIGH